MTDPTGRSTGCRRFPRRRSSRSARWPGEVPGRGEGCAGDRLRRDPGGSAGRAGRCAPRRGDAGPARAGSSRHERGVDRGRGLADHVPVAVRVDGTAGRDVRSATGRRRFSRRRSPSPGAGIRSAASSEVRSSRRSRSCCSAAGFRPGAIRRERRILFDGVPAEIHPYDVTVETPGAAEAYDCKWGARGISADVLHQLDDARAHAAARGSACSRCSSSSMPAARARCGSPVRRPRGGGRGS